MKTAILIDGGFYRKVAIPAFGYKNPEESAKELYSYCVRHLTENLKNEQNIIKHELYKIFYYDCKPLNKQVFHPYLQKTIDLSKTDEYKWMNKFLEEFKKKRKEKKSSNKAWRNFRYINKIHIKRRYSKKINVRYI